MVTTTQAGEYNTGATWVGGVKPGANDTANLLHKVTITNTTEYCRILTIGAGGELEIVASSQDSKLVMSDHTDAKVSFTDSTGILDLNGTSDYWAKIEQAGTNRQWDIDLSDGTTDMDYGYIDYIKPKTQDSNSRGYIDITDATITIDDSRFISENRARPTANDRWYFKGVPTSITVDRMSKFESIYYGLENANYSFQFAEDPTRLDWDQPVIYVENPITGRSQSRLETSGQMAWKGVLTGLFTQSANEYLVDELEDMKESEEQFLFYSPKRVFEHIKVLNVSRDFTPGSPYRHGYIIDLGEDK